MPSSSRHTSRVCSPSSGARDGGGSGMRSERKGTLSTMMGSSPGCSSMRKKSRACRCGSSGYSSARCMKPAGTPAAWSVAVTARGARARVHAASCVVDLRAPRAIRPAVVASASSAAHAGSPSAARRRRQSSSSRTQTAHHSSSPAHGYTPQGAAWRPALPAGPTAPGRRPSSTSSAPSCMRIASACAVATTAPRPDRRRADQRRRAARRRSRAPRSGRGGSSCRRRSRPGRRGSATGSSAQTRSARAGRSPSTCSTGRSPPSRCCSRRRGAG